MRVPALIRTIALAATVSAAACAPVSIPPRRDLNSQPSSGQGDAAGLDRLASDLTPAVPNTQVLNASPGSASCGQARTSIVRGEFAENVLFASNSDQPARDAIGALYLLANQVMRDAPGSEVTVLGHTDALGSDSYNIDLSRRRALAAMRILKAGGLDPNRLTAVAIGRRQPIADNATPQGRARNRRVEFLISGCLAANLGLVRAQASPTAETDGPADVLRLDPAAADGLAMIDAVSLRRSGAGQPVPAMVAPTASTQPQVLQPRANVAKPAPAPDYRLKTLSPDARPNPLGPAVPY